MTKRHIFFLLTMTAATTAGLTFSEPARAARPPEVHSVIEGRDSTTGQPVAVLVGKRVHRYRQFALADEGGFDVGSVVVVLKQRSMVIVRLPASLEPGVYDLVATAKGNVSDVHRVAVTRGSQLPASIGAEALSPGLATDLADAETLDGRGPEFYRDAGNVNAGELDTARFDAWQDLVQSTRVGSGTNQVAGGDHQHDDRYPTQSALGEAGEFNASGNPVDWTKLKNVPDALLDGTAHDHDALYQRKDALADAGTINSDTNPVHWTKLQGVPAGLADGTDADTTYTAGENVTLAGTQFAVPSLPWSSLSGVPPELADGDADTTYSAGSGLSLTGSTFSLDPVAFSSLTGIPSGLADGDDDTTYTAGSGLSLAGSTFSLDDIAFSSLTDVPEGLADGDDDTTYSAGAGLSLSGTAFSLDPIPFSSLTDIPGDLADGDDDTTYAAGSGLSLDGTTFSLDDIAFSSLTNIPTGLSDGDDDTTYSAGSGLSLSGTTIMARFAGSGTATSVARSDHAHTTYVEKTGSTMSGTLTIAVSSGRGIDATTTSTVTGDAAVRGTASASTAATCGVMGETSSASGRGLLARTSSTSTTSAALEATHNGSTLTTSGTIAQFTDHNTTRARFDRDGGVLLLGAHSTQSATRTIPMTGVGTRLMWYPERAAFRAGSVSTTSSAVWDDANVGDYSAATGIDTQASGAASSAAGIRTKASGTAATALGLETTASGTGALAINASTTASGLYSVAMNESTTATGTRSTALGLSTNAQAGYSVVIGRYNSLSSAYTTSGWVTTDPLFVCGNGSSATSRSDAFVVYKNGTVTASGSMVHSDIRLKRDVRSLRGVLARLSRVRGVEFEYRDQKRYPGGRQVGFIAQEVQAEFPELVQETSNGYLSVSYEKFTALLVEAVHEQQAQIDALRAERDDIEARLARLEAAVGVR